jgi:hypothetical protein
MIREELQKNGIVLNLNRQNKPLTTTTNMKHKSKIIADSLDLLSYDQPEPMMFVSYYLFKKINLILNYKCFFFFIVRLNLKINKFKHLFQKHENHQKVKEKFIQLIKTNYFYSIALITVLFKFFILIFF